MWIFRTSPKSGQAYEVQGPIMPSTGSGMDAFGTEVAVSKSGKVIVVSGSESCVWKREKGRGLVYGIDVGGGYGIYRWAGLGLLLTDVFPMQITRQRPTT